MSFTDSVPDYIPDDIQTVYLDEARRRLRQTPQAPSELDAVETPADILEYRALPVPSAARRMPMTTVAAALIGVPGVLAMTTVWAWLAVTRPSPVWWSLTALGGLLSLVGAVAAIRMALAVRAARSPESEPQTPQPQVGDHGSVDALTEYRDAA